MNLGKPDYFGDAHLVMTDKTDRRCGESAAAGAGGHLIARAHCFILLRSHTKTGTSCQDKIHIILGH